MPTAAVDQVQEDNGEEESAEEEPPTSDEEVECLPVTVHDGSTIEIYDDDNDTLEKPKETVQERPKESEDVAAHSQVADVKGSAHPAPASMGGHGGATMGHVPGSVPDGIPDEEKIAEKVQEVLDSDGGEQENNEKSTKGVFKVRVLQLLCNHNTEYTILRAAASIRLFRYYPCCSIN